MRSILLITYFWPPSGKATVHWPLFLSKYLKQYGWGTSVLTVEEDTFSARDETLLKEVDPDTLFVKTKSNDPFRLYKRFIGKKEDESLVASETISKANKNWRHKFAVWIRMNLFVPDARVGWILSAPSGGEKIITQTNPSVIVTIGPPHSAHLIGLKLSKKYKIPFIPVLIDPWVDIAYYRGFKRSRLTLAIDNHLERSVMESADRIIFVTNDTRNHYCLKYPDIEKKSFVCYWGYNEEYFQSVSKIPQDEEVILHAGNIFDFQNPVHFWESVNKEIQNGRKLRLRFAGTVSPGIQQAIDNAGLTPYTEILGFLPYSKVVQEMVNASYLLVCATEKRHVPGKLFEYMRTGNRIIAFGDDNEEVAQLLQMTNSGKIFPYSYHCNDIFEQLASISPDPLLALQFSREKIAEEFAGIIQQAIEKS
jgi:glycosyltransferase involved in cell wall biosynthesis